MGMIRDYDNNLKFPDDFCIITKDFIKCCLKKQPNKRKNTQQLLKHPFLTLKDSKTHDVFSSMFTQVSQVSLLERNKSEINKFMKGHTFNTEDK